MWRLGTGRAAGGQRDSYSYGYGYGTDRYARPMRLGELPPQRYGRVEDEWTALSARRALERGTQFVYGHDDFALLASAFPVGRNWATQVRIEVELQASCARHDGVHLCEIDGRLLSAEKDGALDFEPDGMRGSAHIPAAYVAGFAVP